MTELLYLEAILSAPHESYSFFLSLTHEQSNGRPTAIGSFYVKKIIAFLIADDCCTGSILQQTSASPLKLILHPG